MSGHELRAHHPRKSLSATAGPDPSSFAMSTTPEAPTVARVPWPPRLAAPVKSEEWRDFANYAQGAPRRWSRRRAGPCEPARHRSQLRVRAARQARRHRYVDVHRKRQRGVMES